MKEKEAVALADFLTPMLEWQPEKRATARQILEHPWLYMKSEKNIKMTEKEYRQMTLKQRLENVSSTGNVDTGAMRSNSTGVPQSLLIQRDGELASELCTSESELNCGDVEDNGSTDTESLVGEENDEDAYYNSPLNKYGPNSKLLNVDHGKNPQFEILK